MSLDAVEAYQEAHLCLRCTHGTVCSVAQAANPDLLQAVAICMEFSPEEATPGAGPGYHRTILTGEAAHLEEGVVPVLRTSSGLVVRDSIPLSAIGLKVDVGDRIEILVRDIPAEDE